MNKIKICTLNTRGLGNYKKRQSVFMWLKKSNYNIIFLQETHSTNIVENTWRGEWNDQCLFSHGTSASTGVCILFKGLTHLQISKEFHDDKGRLLVCQIKFGDESFTLCNLYGYNNDNPGFFDNPGVF